jgi:very-short-patch-repair endonuclease
VESGMRGRTVNATLGAMDPVDALTRLGGIASTKQVVKLSSRSKVRTALARGHLIRPGRDRLALPTADKARETAHDVNGYVSHLSAAAHHGWEIKLPPDLPQVTVPRAREISKADRLVEVFRRDIPKADRDGWATTALRTVIDCARDLPFDDALCVADSALRHCSLDKEELMSAAAKVTGRGADRVRLVAAYADGRAANPFESVLRALALLAGVEVIPQYAVTCGEQEYHPDLANPILGLLLEADSWTFHAGKWDHDRDCARYNAMVIAGWTVLRFTWEQVMLSPDYVIKPIRAAKDRAA